MRLWSCLFSVGCRELKSGAQLLAFTGLAVFLTGCGGESVDLGNPVPVTGKITLDGKPAASVEVLLNRVTDGAPGKMREFVATTDAGGEFKIPEVFPAEYRVMIYDRSQENQDPDKIQAMDTGPYHKYGMESTLSATVSPTQQSFTFDLTSR